MGQEYIRNVSLLGLIDFGPTILLNDDFEGNLGWSSEGDAGSTVTLDTSNMFRGSKCLKVLTDSVLPANEAVAQHHCLLRPLSRISINISFKPFSDSSSDWHFKLKFIRYDGTTLHRFAVNYKSSVPAWRYTDSGNNDVEIASLSELSLDTWHSLQLSLDLVNDKYVSLIIDNEIFDMSGIAGYTPASAADRLCLLDLIMDKDATAGAEESGMFVDDVSVIKE